jgi:energy-coupling factor transporter ATP-binding protein EcfA2
MRTTQSPFGVTSISVTDLFGQYNYSLRFPPPGDRGSSNIAILYGDNGSGKTTILKLLYHLLSPSDNRGHRTVLAQTPFKRLHVAFADGAVVSVTRTRLLGSYQLNGVRGEETLFDVQVVTDEENSVPRSKNSGPAYRAFLTFLRRRKTIVHFLPDTRNLESDIFPDAGESPSPPWATRMGQRYSPFDPEYSDSDGDGARQTQLERDMERVLDFIRRHTLKASNIGETNAQKFYLGIIKRLSRGSSARLRRIPSVEELVSRLESVAKRNAVFAAFGLSSAISVDELATCLAEAPSDRREVLQTVTAPYVSSLEARLDALYDTLSLVTTFIDSVNHFYKDKSVGFTASEGIQIRTRGGAILSPNQLSSGERQLLHLMCNTVLARDKASIFLVDEPELSLNVKWQRTLLQALLQLVEGCNVQFILATHSIEILSNYDERVVDLVDTRNGKAQG